MMVEKDTTDSIIIIGSISLIIVIFVLGGALIYVYSDFQSDQIENIPEQDITIVVLDSDFLSRIFFLRSSN